LEFRRTCARIWRVTIWPISRIAWLLAFQEVSAFTHAFKRWKGQTPSQMRAKIAAQASSAGDAGF
jgi:AraC-like DNA-binding protein